jgi:hypothetical protein
MIPEDMSGGVDMPRPRRALPQFGSRPLLRRAAQEEMAAQGGDHETLWRRRRFLGGSPIGGEFFLGRRGGSLRGGFWGIGGSLGGLFLGAGSRIARRFISMTALMINARYHGSI